MKLDFQDRLYEAIATLELPIPFHENVMIDRDSVALYSLPGGRQISGDMSGTKYKQLNYEVQGKSKDPEMIQKTITRISEFLEDLEDIESSNDSFQFDQIKISSEPFYSSIGEDGFYYFTLNFQAFIDIY